MDDRLRRGAITRATSRRETARGRSRRVLPDGLLSSYESSAATSSDTSKQLTSNASVTTLQPGAWLMIAAGCQVKVIAEQMGHSDGGGLVLKRYGHLYKGARRQAAVDPRGTHPRPGRRSGCGTDVG